MDKKYKTLMAMVILMVLTIFPVVNAETSIGDTTLTLEVTNDSIKITNEEYSGNDQSFNLNYSNCSVDTFEETFSIMLVKNESVSSSMVNKYTECLKEKSKCDTEKNSINLGWNDCKRKLTECTENQNKTETSTNECETKLDDCQTNKNDCETDLEKKRLKVESLEQSQSNKWLFGIAGLIIGWVAAKKGKEWLMPKAKSGTDEFSQNQAG